SYSSTITRIKEAWFRGSRDVGDRRVSQRLLGWLAVAQVLHGLTVWKFIEFTKADYQSGSVLENLPGRLVALSFSFVAIRYYANILSGVSGARISRKTEASFRVSAFLER